MKNVVAGDGGSGPTVIGERFLRKRFFFREPPGNTDPNTVLAAAIFFPLLIAAYALLSDGLLSRIAPWPWVRNNNSLFTFVRFLFFDWPRGFYEARPREMPSGLLPSNETIAFIISFVIALPLAYFAARWLRKSAPHYIVVTVAAANYIFGTGLLSVMWAFFESAMRTNRTWDPFLPSIDMFRDPALLLVGVWLLRSEWASTFKPLDLSQFGRSETATRKTATRSFDGSTESIEALQRFAPGSAPAASATVGGAPPDIRGLDAQGVAELVARTNAGERYADVAASLLARGSARPVETEGPTPRPAPLSSGKLDDFDDL